jgi:hypothetical protein
MWKLFSINKKESLVEILERYTAQEKEVFVYCVIKDMDEKSLRGLIWETHPTLHIHRNPPKTATHKEKSVTYDVLVNGERLASTTGSENDAKKEAEHYATMYVGDGVIQILKKVRKSYVRTGMFI